MTEVPSSRKTKKVKKKVKTHARQAKDFPEAQEQNPFLNSQVTNTITTAPDQPGKLLVH